MSTQNEKQSTTIEPPCQDCLKARASTHNPNAWCARHSEHHVHGHTYGYDRELPLAQHDSNNESPIGTDPPAPLSQH